MGIIDRLFKRKPKKVYVEEETKQNEITDFQKVCTGDVEVYEALKDVMFLDPRKIKVSIKDAIANAKKLEKEGNNLRASVWYRIAGGLALYEGDVRKVKEFFGKYSKLTGKDLKILEIPEKAVKKAREYYEKYLKEKVWS